MKWREYFYAKKEDDRFEWGIGEACAWVTRHNMSRNNCRMAIA